MTKPNPRAEAPTGKHPGGRPSKKESIPEEQLKALYQSGWTDKQVVDFFNIDESTLTRWKQTDEKFYTSIKDWKAEADGKIELSLRDRALGYSHPETKAQWVGDRWEYAELTKHYPPDPTSMVFWLKNRHPDKWKDKHDMDLAGLVSVLTVLPEELRAAITEQVKKGKK